MNVRHRVSSFLDRHEFEITLAFVAFGILNVMVDATVFYHLHVGEVAALSDVDLSAFESSDAVTGLYFDAAFWSLVVVSLVYVTVRR